MTGKPAQPEAPGPPPSSTPADDEATGLPGLSSWRAVYGAVLGMFALWVVLLTVLTWWYS